MQYRLEKYNEMVHHQKVKNKEILSLETKFTEFSPEFKKTVQHFQIQIKHLDVIQDKLS